MQRNPVSHYNNNNNSSSSNNKPLPNQHHLQQTSAETKKEFMKGFKLAYSFGGIESMVAGITENSASRSQREHTGNPQCLFLMTHLLEKCSTTLSQTVPQIIQIGAYGGCSDSNCYYRKGSNSRQELN